MHISDDTLELYCLGKLPITDQAPVEEHILSCPACAARAQEWQEYINAMRAALKKKGRPISMSAGG